MYECLDANESADVQVFESAVDPKRCGDSSSIGSYTCSRSPIFKERHARIVIGVVPADQMPDSKGFTAEDRSSLSN